MYNRKKTATTTTATATAGMPAMKALCAACAIALLPAAAQASGYSFSTQSAAAQSTSNASMAEAADASTLYSNPAGMVLLKGKNNLSANLIYVAPDVEYYDARANYTTPSALAGGRVVPGHEPGPVAGSSSGQIAKSAAAPHAYYTRSINPRLTAGIGMYVPYGTSGEYQHNSVLRYNGNQLSIKGLAISPTIAWKANERHSFGFGLTAQHLEAEMRQYANFAGLLNQAMARDPRFQGLTPVQQAARLLKNGQADGYAQIKGDSWDWGFHLGWMGNITDRTRLGVSYRSKIKHTLKGSSKWRYSASPALAGALGAAPRAAGYAADEGAEVDVTTPASLSIHGMHRANDQWTLFGDLTWTGHSEFDVVNILYANPKAVTNARQGGATQSNRSVLVPNWKDSYKLALGAAYDYTPSTQLRFGFAFDKTPIPSADYRLTTSPGHDRMWYSFGIKTEVAANTSLNLAYTYVDIKDSRANVNGFCGGTAAFGPNTVNCVSSRTTGSARYKSQAHILGVQLNYAF